MLNRPIGLICPILDIFVFVLEIFTFAACSLLLEFHGRESSRGFPPEITP